MSVFASLWTIVIRQWYSLSWKKENLAWGTAWSNGVDLRREICDSNEKEVKGLKIGEALYRQKGNLMCVTWHDRKPVSVLSTILTSKTDSSTVQQSVKVTWHWQKKKICLTRCYLYARLMKGVTRYHKRFFLHDKGVHVHYTHSSYWIQRPW